jgi:dihydroorotate dehydrogenase (NAD+) catalytic subunit
MIELNISCPNVKEGGMLFGLDPESAGSVVSAVRRACTKPLIVKLSPNAPDLIAVAAECEKQGADALSLVNTFRGMAIDTQKRKPVFNNISAGLSGPAIRPIALRMVWEIVEHCSLPVIGLGGIDSPESALEFLLAGAACIEVGCATFPNPCAMVTIISGITDYMKTHHITKLSGLSIR